MKFFEIVRNRRKTKIILQLADKYPTPFYVFDKENFVSQILMFKKVFLSHLYNFRPYYAIKSNPHDLLIKEVLANGIGLDVSSGRELEIALKHNAKNILFSGPGKTDAELHFAVNNSCATINIDSFGELRRLASMTTIKKRKINAGVRISTATHGIWDKFGIPIESLARFWQEVENCEYISLCGIQMHNSWNTDAKPYVAMLKNLGSYLRKKFSAKMLAAIRFIDFGGGFAPDYEEGTYVSKKTLRYRMDRAATLESYADEIGKAVGKYLGFLDNHEYFAEPGRILSTYAMHIVLRVVDVKSDRCVIADGGNNMIGWEKYEEFYAPVYNITNFAEKEIPVTIYGSLCTPHDIWGYRCYASKMEEGDILFIPNQGAYTYALAQKFIKPFPEVVSLLI